MADSGIAGTVAWHVMCLHEQTVPNYKNKKYKMNKCLLLLGITYLGCGVAAEPSKTKTTDKQAQTKSDKYQGADMVTYGTSTDRT
ncbi:MAG: hypothetical protein ACXWTY_02120, partial [Methylobacter sp.]